MQYLAYPIIEPKKKALLLPHFQIKPAEANPQRNETAQSRGSFCSAFKIYVVGISYRICGPRLARYSGDWSHERSFVPGGASSAACKVPSSRFKVRFGVFFLLDMSVYVLSNGT